jgi:predicted permease
MRWLMRLIRGRRLDDDLDRELRFHLDEETARLEAEGLPPADARRRALAGFGGLEPIRERAREARGTAWLIDLGRDVGYALRMLSRTPVFTATALASLAIGIGANAAIFSIIDALMMRPLPVSRPDELFFLNRAGLDERNLRFSYPMVERFREQADGGEYAAMTPVVRLQVRRGESSELVFGQLVSGNWFSVLGVTPALGRLFTPSDNRTVDAHPVVVLSHGYWTRAFGADPGIVGRSLVIDGVPLQVLGVTPEGFGGVFVGTLSDVWVPLMMQHAVHHRSNASTSGAADANRPWPPQEDIEWLRVVGRAPLRARAAVEARLGGVFRRHLEQELGDVPDQAEREVILREHIELLPGERGLSDLREALSQPLTVLMATVAVVLLIACANLASLLLARSAAREREFSLRLSLGARRARLVRQLLTESLSLALIGGGFAMAFAFWASRALLRLTSSGPAMPIDTRLDWPVVAFTLAVSVATGLAFGLAPAIKLSRADPGHALRGAGRILGAARTRTGFSMGRLLVGAQVALSLVLMVGALLLLRTFSNLLDIEPGYDQNAVVSTRLEPRLAGVTAAELPALYTKLIDLARTVPGVTSATLASSGPVSGSSTISAMGAEGQAGMAGRVGNARVEFVGPDFFETLGIPLRRGRRFGTTDHPGSPDVGIVNEAFARHFFGDLDPIGKHVGYGPDPSIEIVGVAPDTTVDGLRREVPPLIYLALGQHEHVFAQNLYVRFTDAPDAAVGPIMARVVAGADARVAIREVATLSELTRRTVGRDRLVTHLTSVFALLAVGVACLGLFGTVSYSVARRTNEIGVRIALGASAAGVRWMVLRELLWLVGAACAAGLVLALVSLRFVASLLYGLSPHDPVTLGAAVLLLLAVGLASGLVPAWRASRVDPLTALRA